MGTVAETYISLDIETTGPVPGIHNMIEVGLCVCDGEYNKTFQACLKGFAADNYQWVWDAGAYGTYDWWHKEERLPLLYDIEMFAHKPENVMPDLGRWIDQFKNPVIVSFGGDHPFLVHAWHKVFEGACLPPFGYIGMDLKTMLMNVTGCSFEDTRQQKWRKEYPQYTREDLPHTHRALDDAREQAFLFDCLQEDLIMHLGWQSLKTGPCSCNGVNCDKGDHLGKPCPRQFSVKRQPLCYECDN